jgi:hypothetical protein
MLNEIQGQTAAQKLLFEINRLREFEMADMTHVCCRREFARARKPMDDAEVDEIVDEENEFVKNLEDTMRNRSFNPDNESVEGTWLSLIGDFWTPLKGPRLWASWDPTTGQLNGQAPLNPNLFIHSDTTAGMRFYIEEEEDQFLFSPKGFPAPESSIYAAWVEWAYQNSDRYDYPLSVDKNWYEKRKYWAARQAEVLKGLS